MLQQPARAGGDAAGMLRRPRLLLVDDDRRFTRLLSTLLTDRGFEVTTCPGSGDRLWEDDLGEQPAFDGAIVDLVLGSRSGMEVLERLRAGDPTLPLALISGHAVDPYLNDASGLGASIFVKPFRVDVLDAFLEKARAHHAAGLSPLELLAPRLALSERERECFEMRLAHRTNQEIANDLDLGLETVKGYVLRALAKLGHDSVDDVRRALRELRGKGRE
jgi:FixJ family two-component response regulator